MAIDPIASQAMSKNEENYGHALEKLKIPFAQQIPIGQRGVRGSQSIDLVAYVPPKPAAIFIQGEHWHTARTAAEDQIKQAEAEHAGYWLVLVSEEDSATPQAALAHAKKTFRG